jgi:hypothetical protein
MLIGLKDTLKKNVCGAMIKTIAQSVLWVKSKGVFR